MYLPIWRLLQIEEYRAALAQPEVFDMLTVTKKIDPATHVPEGLRTSGAMLQHIWFR
jgi:hypothetical protein